MLFHKMRIPDGSEIWENTLFKTDDVDLREFQPLGGIQGNEVDSVTNSPPAITSGIPLRPLTAVEIGKVKEGGNRIGKRCPWWNDGWDKAPEAVERSVLILSRRWHNPFHLTEKRCQAISQDVRGEAWDNLCKGSNGIVLRVEEAMSAETEDLAMFIFSGLLIRR